ncbi:MAG: type II toxin-antitoxin system VapC family toxin [Leptolyngbya sp. UWPOB_LEPTO1]|uniref:type II toxin-antitoxin system VapC family toxin n=1 Tax=Leptolyngbya sp. UWPOB_LEPTO1 TaxID=2815653 RepID=UPI001AC27041|nr:type II toxin-antitoxin system VapC family toxin [Leptolyngbya sp. UWPOB_LEPTO1]MBN8559446.1 type II toxin-antitoxin system VapC family toxin [Leptolyngbya sp. UWPOB_LEPTO1]
MRLLLDTHAFLWFIAGSSDLSNKARTLIEDPNNQRFLSVASLWEMSIKVSIGKLDIGMTFTELMQHEVYGNAIEVLQIRSEHLDALAKLPFHHKDPFDRLIIAQSLAESTPLVSKDGEFGNYSVTLLW